MLPAVLALLLQDPEAVRAAVGKAIPLLEKSAEVTIKERTCFTCHNAGAPVLALTAARKSGFKIDEAGYRAVLQHTEASLARSRKNYEQGKGQGGQVDHAGWALWTLEVGGWKPDATTAAVAHYLAVRDQDRGHWVSVSNRPPTEASAFTATFLGIAGLRAFASGDDAVAADVRLAAARKWLLETKPKDTEDRVFRLRALEYADVPEEAVEAAAKDLLSTQREDGGWAQLPGGESDAYGTATALAALAQSGGISVRDPAWRKGLTWLLAAQKEDGSWHVKTRSKPFQTYFESGFPHGKDQFISITASSWAVVALSLSLAP